MSLEASLNRLENAANGLVSVVEDWLTVPQIQEDLKEEIADFRKRQYPHSAFMVSVLAPYLESKNITKE